MRCGRSCRDTKVNVVSDALTGNSDLTNGDAGNSNLVLAALEKLEVTVGRLGSSLLSALGTGGWACCSDGGVSGSLCLRCIHALI